MDSFSTLNLPDGKIAFQGMIRCDDALVHEFRIEFPEKQPLYGEWRPRFAENGIDFDIEVTTFGYVSKFNVRNPHPDARIRFSAQENLLIEQLVRALFADEIRRSGISPFTSKKARFVGGVTFLSGWIARRDI